MITKIQDLALKVESSRGTAESPTASDATMRTYDLDFALDGEAEYLSAANAGNSDLSVAQELPGTLSFRGKLHGSGVAATDPAWASTLLEAANLHGATHVYTPTLGGATALTAAFYRNGGLWKLAGSAAGFTMSGTAGRSVDINWKLQGKRVTPTTASIITPTKTTVVPPRWANTGNTIGGTAYLFGKFELDCGAVLHPIPDGDEATGIAYFEVVDWSPKLVTTIRAQTAHDFYADYLARTSRAIVIAVGTSSDNTVTLNFGACTLASEPKMVDDNGVTMQELTWRPQNSTGNTTDFMTITFS